MGKFSIFHAMKYSSSWDSEMAAWLHIMNAQLLTLFEDI